MCKLACKKKGNARRQVYAAEDSWTKADRAVENKQREKEGEREQGEGRGRDLLKGAESRGVWRRDIYNEVVSNIAKLLNTPGKVLHGIALLVLPEVNSNDSIDLAPALAQLLEALVYSIASLAVEAVSIDDALIINKAKHAREGVAWLGLGGYASDLNVRETHADGADNSLGLLVPACRDPNCEGGEIARTKVRGS